MAERDPELEYALSALHDLFAQAPILGTLLEPSGGDLFEAEKMHQIERLLEPLLERARHGEPERAEGVIAARGMADASVLLHRTYSLIVTNVPFLGKGSNQRPFHNTSSGTTHIQDRVSQPLCSKELLDLHQKKELLPQ